MIRKELNRILNSKTFAGSERLCRFLTFTVEKALQEEAEINQYAIGREVFDRGEDFDPRADPIVRTEARRLRNKLDEYYPSRQTALRTHGDNRWPRASRYVARLQEPG